VRRLKFTISVGNSRRDKTWRNIDLTWDEFIDRVKDTRRTNETVDEYKKFSKVKQDEIKDVGGFVGGKLKEGKRKNGYVEYKSMLTLDMDYATRGLWNDISMLYDFSCCIYSTHKHTDEKPRLRLIIPLSRNVTPDEYSAIARMVASDIGIEQFDDTTYEPTRLMYWPSTSLDGRYIFEEQKGNLLNPDEILNRYENWQNTSSWPISSRQKEIVKRRIEKQADPLEKDGIVGVFCRTYSIEEAINIFISDVYKTSLLEGRYDYVPADSSAGVVVYEDKFVYSHHATDPACGKLCNSFDIVRIHKFGELDKSISEDIAPSKLPSYKAMEQLSIKDEKVKFQLIKEREEKAKEEFESMNSLNWQTKLQLNRDGSIKDTPTNILSIIRFDENLKGIAYNLMNHSIDINGVIPWEQVKSGWNDSDLANLKMYFDNHYGIWSPQKIKDALLTAATERKFHPVKEYLEGLPKWDGIERINTLLTTYLGAEDNLYTRAIIRKTMCAAVKRIFEPGTKFDHILVLNGPQGIGKSTFFAKLGSKWYSDSLTISDMKDKAAAEKLQGYWVLELGELAGIKKVDVETVKGFISRVDDKFRASYGVNVESHPRQCVIVGSTNSTGGFLRDVTGNRRFWPVRVNGTGIKKPWDIEDIDEIWAEAVELYRKGEDLFLNENEARMAFREQQEAMESDDREGLVAEYLERLLPANWGSMDLYERRSFLSEGEFDGSEVVGTVVRDRVCIMEIWCECFCKERSNIKKGDSYEIESILNRIGGWKKYDGNATGKMKFSCYGVQRAFVREKMETK
jgi:predicted P-loop ATPase